MPPGGSTAVFVSGGSEHAHAALAEAEVGGVTHLVDLAAHGAVVCQLHQGVAHHDVVVLVSAHEAAQHHLAGQCVKILFYNY